MIADDIEEERARQRAKFGCAHDWGSGDCSTSTVADRASYGDTADMLRLTVLVEEVGEVARAVCDRSHYTQLRAELVQVAAVAVAWIEAVDGNA